jgi:hypothetical protein
VIPLRIEFTVLPFLPEQRNVGASYQDGIRSLTWLEELLRGPLPRIMEVALSTHFCRTRRSHHELAVGSANSSRAYPPAALQTVTSLPY